MSRRRALDQLSAGLRGKPVEPSAWSDVLAMANEGLVTTALRAAQRLSPAVWRSTPSDVRTFLDEVHRRNAARNASLAATLKDVLAALNPQGVRPILLKGCATWVREDGRLSASASHRMVSDLDLVTPGADFDIAIDALSQAGFEILEDSRGQAFHPVVVFGRPGDAGSIDLHQRSPGPAGLAAIDNLRAHCRLVDVDGLKAMAPSPELQILISVLHDQLQDGCFWRGGFNLRHLIDIAELSHRPPGVDWKRLTVLSGGGLATLVLRAQLVAARAFAAAQVPDAIGRSVWGRLHFARQRLQFTHPQVNAPFHKLGLTWKVWRLLSGRRLGGARGPDFSAPMAGAGWRET